MSIGGKVILVSLLVLSICGKFSESPDYSFTVWDPAKIDKVLLSITLSTDDDMLSVYSIGLFNLKNHHTIYNFDGSTRCDVDYPFDLVYLRWPSQTSGFFIGSVNKTMLKAASPCAYPQQIASVPTNYIGVETTYTSKESYIGFAYDDKNKIIEYNLGNGASKQYNFDNATEKIIGIDYSPDHDYLYALTQDNDKQKIIVYDADSGEKKRQIFTDYFYVKGNADGDGFVAAASKYSALYYVDKDGNQNKIWTQTSEQTKADQYFQTCTDDLKIITIRASGTEQDLKIQIVSYDSDDGSQSQAFQIDFVPDLSFKRPVICNDKYLSVFDVEGKVHIFQYSRPFPVWAIILIVVGSLLIIGGGVAGFIIYKRRKSQKAEGYQQFSQEQKERNGI